MIRGLDDFVGLLERAGLGLSFTAFTKDGDEECGTKRGSGGGGGGPREDTGGGGGGGGLKLPLKDELEGINISGDGGGGNSGEVEHAGGGLRVEPCGVVGSGGTGGGETALELGGRGGGNGGGGLRGVLGAEEEEKGSGGGGGGAGPELLVESEVLEDREVDEEEMDTEDRRDDFLSGTLGLGRLLEGDMDLTNEGTGVPAVGVLDWLE